MTAEEVFRSGVIAVDAGALEEAREVRQELTRMGCVDEARVLNGGILAQNSKWQAALAMLDPSLAREHLRHPLLLWAGECFLKMRELGRAELVLNILVAEFPRDSKALRMLAITYYDLGAMFPAENCLERLKALEPKDFTPHFLLGVIHLDFERAVDAVNDFERALSLRPPEDRAVEIKLHLARALLRSNQGDRALQTLKGMPESPRSLALEAICLLGQGDDKRAETRIRQGKELQGASEEPEAELLRAEAKLMRLRGDYKSLITVLKRHAELEPHSLETLHALSLAFGHLGRKGERDAAVAKASRVRELHHLLGELSKKANADPNDAEVRARMASICSELGLAKLSSSWNHAAAAIRDSADWSRER